MYFSLLRFFSPNKRIGENRRNKQNGFGKNHRLTSRNPEANIHKICIKKAKYAKKCIKRLGGLIENRKLTIAGNIRVPSMGLCPLNANLASFSRLSCKAKCHEGTFAIEDPNLQKIYPFIPDGFCRMHMFKSELLDFSKYTKIFEEIGINEFVIDMSCLTEEYLPILLTEFINSLSDKTPAQLPILTEHLM